MAAAYAYAEGGPISPELLLLNRVEKFGVYAVMARPYLYFHEIRRMEVAQTIKQAYDMRAAAANWQAFQTEHPQLGNLLFRAQQLAEQNGRNSKNSS